MSTHSVRHPFGGAAVRGPEQARTLGQRVLDYWWLSLVAGICWIVVSLVILQFNSASINTIGLIVGAMFIVSGLQQFVLASVVDSMRWLWTLFGALLVIAGFVCFFNPADTFRGLADVLGFLFLVVGTWWTIRAFLVRPVEPTWWLGLVAGTLMIIMAFWTSGQFYIQKAYTLLVFAGIWALMHGITDIFRAFAMKSVRDTVEAPR
jgi:uncharacterized membrane protein HdeD (DUF308 family)